MRILVMGDGWSPDRGGVSSFNRHLCIALAQAGAEVMCAVPSTTQPEREDAAARNIRLINAPTVGVDLRQRPAPVPATSPSRAPSTRSTRTASSTARTSSLVGMEFIQADRPRPARLGESHGFLRVEQDHR